MKECELIKGGLAFGLLAVKVLEFQFFLKVLKIVSLEVFLTLNVVAWKVLLMLFGCPKQNIKHNSEKLKVIYRRHFLFYARFIVNLRHVN